MKPFVIFLAFFCSIGGVMGQQNQLIVIDTVFNPVRSHPKGANNGDRFTVAMSIPLSDDYEWGYRDTGDYTQIDNVEGGIITLMWGQRLLPYDGSEGKGNSATYIGIDDQGRIRVDTKDWFARQYEVSATDKESKPFLAKQLGDLYHTDVIDMAPNDKWEFINDKGNKGYVLPLVAAYPNANRVPVGIIAAKNKSEKSRITFFGGMTGGRAILQALDPATYEPLETRLVAGSLKNINDELRRMKELNKVPFIRLYKLDNGSYWDGLAFKDKTFTEKRLRAYDNQTLGGPKGGAVIFYKKREK
jgi:hypothetical protein